MPEREIETQGPTIEEAIQKGLAELKVDKNEVEIHILDEGSSGLFGLMGAKPAIVQLRVKTPATSIPQEPGYARAQVKTKEIIDQLLPLMDIAEYTYTVEDTNKEITLVITTPDSARLIGRQGKTMYALQTIVNLILAHDPATRVMISVDVNGYRKQYEEKLIMIAHQIADEVKRTGQQKILQPMPAHERKIIHQALKDYTHVITESTGTGNLRAVVIKPKHT